MALSALASVGVLLVVIVSGLSAVSTWAERDLHAFPFKDEDWLRYLLPARFEALDRDRIMLAGPSTVRENFRYDIFEAEFPSYDVYQGGISLGTLDDTTAALEYVEKVYGAGALPKIVVLGISPRFIAGIPDDRPFALGLNRYSPYYAAVQEPIRIALEPKGTLESVLARARFLAAKSPERFRTGLLATVSYVLSESTSESGEEPALAQAIDWLLRNPLSASLIGSAGFSHVIEFEFPKILQWVISPYKYSLKPPRQYRLITREDYEPKESEDWWPSVYFWDPRKNEAEARARLKYFVDFVNRNGIRVLVINMPERDVSRIVFDETDYRTYLELVRSELNGIRFINLREFMDTVEFYDREHTTPAGSVRLSQEIVQRMRATVLSPGN